jgi:hypothetical protein
MLADVRSHRAAIAPVVTTTQLPKSGGPSWSKQLKAGHGLHTAPSARQAAAGLAGDPSAASRFEFFPVPAPLIWVVTISIILIRRPVLARTA